MNTHARRGTILVALLTVLSLGWAGPASAASKNIVDDCVSGYLRVTNVGGGRVDVDMKASSGFQVLGRTTIYRSGVKYRTKWSQDRAWFRSNIRHTWNDLYVGKGRSIRVTANLTGQMATTTCTPGVAITIRT